MTTLFYILLPRSKRREEKVHSFVSRSPSATTLSMTSASKPDQFFLPQTNHSTAAKIQICTKSQ